MGNTRAALVRAVVVCCFLVTALLVGCASSASTPTDTSSSGSTSPAATATTAPQNKTAYPVVSVQCGAKDHPTPCVK
jgi:uncharacterized membrane protein